MTITESYIRVAAEDEYKKLHDSSTIRPVDLIQVLNREFAKLKILAKDSKENIGDVERKFIDELNKYLEKDKVQITVDTQGNPEHCHISKGKESVAYNFRDLPLAPPQPEKVNRSAAPAESGADATDAEFEGDYRTLTNRMRANNLPGVKDALINFLTRGGPNGESGSMRTIRLAQHLQREFPDNVTLTPPSIITIHSRDNRQQYPLNVANSSEFTIDRFPQQRPR